MVTVENMLDQIVRRLGAMPQVQAVGISGGKTPLPKKGEGDIDVLIYCSALPPQADRQTVLADLPDGAQGGRIKVFEGKRWGSGDYVLLNGVETWLMYFTTAETLTDVQAVLAGEQPDKQDNYYYPIGRLGMLQRMAVLYDREGFLRELHNRLATYPADLGKTLAAHHLRALADTEDLDRAVTRRDALFYHFALDLALDHFCRRCLPSTARFFPAASARWSTSAALR